MQTLCASKGQILELDQTELDPAELARAATQMAMDEVKENQQSYKDSFLTDELKSTVPSKDLFHQRLIDNTQDFDDQVKYRWQFPFENRWCRFFQRVHMEHLIKTNGLDGVPFTDVSTNEAPGGIWKQIIYAGVGEKPSLGSTVRLHYNAYFELSDEPYDSTVRFSSLFLLTFELFFFNQHVRRRPCEFQLGKFNVLPGLDFAVRTMQRRERAKFIISSDLLYGEHGDFSLIFHRSTVKNERLYVFSFRLSTTNSTESLVSLCNWIDFLDRFDIGR